MTLLRSTHASTNDPILFLFILDDLICKAERDTDIENKYMDIKRESGGGVGGTGRLGSTHICY